MARYCPTSRWIRRTPAAPAAHRPSVGRRRSGWVVAPGGYAAGGTEIGAAGCAAIQGCALGHRAVMARAGAGNQAAAGRRGVPGRGQAPGRRAVGLLAGAASEGWARGRRAVGLRAGAAGYGGSAPRGVLGLPRVEARTWVAGTHNKGMQPTATNVVQLLAVNSCSGG